MRARDTIGITARDTLCRHGRAGPGHPDAVRRGASHHRDHRDEPGDDGEGAVGGCEGPNEIASGTRRRPSIGITGTDPRIKPGEVMTKREMPSPSVRWPALRNVLLHP